MSPKTKAIIQLLICSGLWSIGGIFIKLLNWNPFVIAGLRSLLCGLVVFVYMRIAKLPVVLNRKSVLSSVALWATFECFVGANKLTTAANAIVLQFTAPIFVVIISVLFLHKKMAKADIITALLTLGGISLFFLDQLSPGHLFGNLVAIMAGVSLGAFYVALGEASESERMSGIVFANILTFAVGLPFVFLTEPEFSATSMVCIVILGVLQLGIPYVLLALASGKCPPLVCSLLGVLEPLLNPVWVLLFNGETPGIFALVGGIIVIVTITAWCVYGGKKDKTAVEDTANG